MQFTALTKSNDTLKEKDGRLALTYYNSKKPTWIDAAKRDSFVRLK